MKFDANEIIKYMPECELMNEAEASEYGIEMDDEMVFIKKDANVTPQIIASMLYQKVKNIAALRKIIANKKTGKIPVCITDIKIVPIEKVYADTQGRWDFFVNKMKNLDIDRVLCSKVYVMFSS